MPYDMLRDLMVYRGDLGRIEREAGGDAASIEAIGSALVRAQAGLFAAD